MAKQQTRIGILLVNLGTPDAPEASALRSYLREFLSDKRVVDAPRWWWWPVLNGIILRIRPPRSARNYRKIWTDRGSPLMFFTQDVGRSLQEKFDANGFGNVTVAVAMRYGRPGVGSVMNQLRSQGLTHLAVLPLFPQFSATTSASVFDCVGANLRQWRDLPHLHIVREYHMDAGYIRALADSITRRWTEHGRPQKLLFSFHGIPQRYATLGDPYPEQCHATARAVASRLNLRDDEWMTTFQSRFGREPWLQPYTDITLEGLARQGIRTVSVICPGFAMDCLETLEEIEVENAELFRKNGGVSFDYIPALNASEGHVLALYNIIHSAITCWR